MAHYRAGIDIGSTTVKLVLLDETGNKIYGNYMRHQAHTQNALAELLRDVRAHFGSCSLSVCITGSGSINLSKALSIPFVLATIIHLLRKTWN